MSGVAHDYSLVSSTTVTHSIRRPPGLLLFPLEEFKLEWGRVSNKFRVRASVGSDWIPFEVEDIRALPTFRAPRFRNTSAWIVRVATGFIVFSIHHSVMDKLPYSAFTAVW